MIITRTPYRVSFFGGGTDYPAWYRRHGGQVLTSSIDKYCYLSCRWLPPFFEHHSRVAYSKVEMVRNNSDIAHPAVRACLQFLGIDQGVEIHHDGDLPARTGLGSSSAFTVGLLHALHALKGEMVAPRQLAREAIHVEQVILAENVGVQDQTITAHGGLNRIQFRPDDSSDVQPLLVSRERLVALERCLLLGFTGFSRFASEIARQQIENTPFRETQLRRMHTMVDEGVQILVSSDPDLSGFGRLLDEAWELKRSLSQSISTSAIDSLYRRGRSAGALGGKLLGAGGGGFLLFFVLPEVQPAFLAAMTDLLWVPIGLAAAGSQVVYYQNQEPYQDSLVQRRRQMYAQRA